MDSSPGQTDVTMSAMRGPNQRRTFDDIRRLEEAGVVNRELLERLRRDDRPLSLCWCGFDMVEHSIDVIDVGDGGSPPIQDHQWMGSGTRDLSWLLSLNPGREPFDHIHDRENFTDGRSVSEVCVLCRIEAAESQRA